ncbi:MAG: hypothetical protein CMH59_13095 [Myxococcales bacterium]|nr:hypothetical protein [Myxococcales bacterium]
MGRRGWARRGGAAPGRGGVGVLVACLLAVACGDDDGVADAAVDAGRADAGPDAGELAPPPVIGAVEESARLPLPGLGAPAYAVFVEAAVPHVYAETEADAARVLGFVTARDRFFEMDMARRLSQGRIAELLGQDAFAVDVESRGTGMARVAAAILARFTDDQRARYQAYVDGVNAYIAAVRARRAFAPREYTFAAPVFGVRPADLMADFTLADVAALSATTTYELGFETTDLGRQRGLEQVPGRFDGEPLGPLRQAGLEDAFFRVTNSNGVRSAAGWGLATGSDLPLLEGPGASLVDLRWRPSLAGLDRLLQRAERIQRRLGRTHDEGFGSNAWAVMGSATTDGAAILAGDGHLPGSVPTLFYRAGVDTRLLGEGDEGLRQVGLFFPGLPIMAVGTNGDVAWNQTQFFGDITDWYAEELLLDADGAPRATRFRGEERALVAVDEVYEIADVPALGSVGRTETLTRYETFDGRLITAIEGREVAGPDAAGEGETAVNLLGDWVVPEDTDEDGVVRAFSFDYTALDGPNQPATLEAWGRAETVEEMREGATALVAYSQNVVAADATGSVLYLPYQVMPCRAHLERDADGRWVPGAHPGFVLDGTRFGGFALPLDAEGHVDEAAGTTPETCVVPLDEYPAALDPGQGFVVSANNDPGEMTADNDLQDDPWYIGGPWHEDFRAARISEVLRAGAGAHDEDAMAALQADVRSPLGALLVPLLLEALEAGRAASEGSPAPGTVEARLAALWAGEAEAFADVEARLRAWRDAGFVAASGVETFYHPSVSDEERADAVATTLFNAWLGPFERRVLGDEGFPPSTYTPTGSGGRMRILTRLVNGRGADDPLGLASFHAATGESAFFDVRDTAPIETSLEVALEALEDALAFLRSEPTGPGAGGFGTDDASAWIWGLRHTTRFDALIADFLEGDESFGFLVDAFSIPPETLPLAEGLEEGDPRFGLRGFPRPGDNFVVDAANSGFSGERFTFGSIAVFRMVVALRGEETTGRDVLPAGQSGDPESPHFADQAVLWLGNETTPMHLAPEAVAAAGTRRETFLPE